jgi:membrane-associated phospholipid phosphatase
MAIAGSRRMPAAVAAFAALAVVVSATGGGLAARADQAVFEHVRARRSRTGIVLAGRVSALAEPAVVYPLLAAAGVHAARTAGWRRACEPCLVVAGGALVRRLLSQVIARPRPPSGAWLAEPEGFSLPSRHTTLAALAAGVCVRAAGAGAPAGQAAPLLAAAGIGASRVYLGVHWPSDVIAGWLFAEGWLRLTGTGRSAGRKDAHGRSG